MSIRLIAIDIDGTLLDSQGRLPPPNLAAIEAALARGIEVALVTGRSFHFARPVAALLPSPISLIVSNGALMKAGCGTTRWRRLLPRGVAIDVLASAPEYRAQAVLIFDRPAARQVVCERMDWHHPNRRGYYERYRECIAESIPLESALTEDPVQVMFNGAVIEMRALLARLRAHPLAHRYRVTLTEYAERDFSLLDVMTGGCTKGSTLAHWAGQRGWAPHEIMAVGDNYNDREMLEFAGMPVVMGNAVPELKTAGWPVTGTNDEAGLAAAIERFALRSDSS
jgi:Cof subfamily protein (haloacid dehalogenase superfamily)